MSKQIIKKILPILSASTMFSVAALISTSYVVANYSNNVDSIENKTGIKFEFGSSSIYNLQKEKINLINENGDVPKGVFLKIKVKKINFENKLWNDSNKKTSSLNLDWELNYKDFSQPSERSFSGNKIFFSKEKNKKYAYFSISFNSSTTFANFAQEKILTGKYELNVFNKINNHGAKQLVLTNKISLSKRDIDKKFRVEHETNKAKISYSSKGDGENIAVSINVKGDYFPTRPWWDIFHTKDLDIYGGVSNGQPSYIDENSNTTVEKFMYQGYNSSGLNHVFNYSIHDPELLGELSSNVNLYFTFNQIGFTVEGQQGE